MKWLIMQVTGIFAVVLLLCTQTTALSARNAVVMDAATGKTLFEQEADARCLIASTTKIMTGLLICEDCDLSREVEVPAEAQGIEGSSLYLKAGERLTIENLLYGMMLRSGNDAAVALAIVHSGSVEAFAARMNQRAGKLGLSNTHFANPHGLDDEGNYSTCRDLAMLGAFAMQNAAFAKAVSTKQYSFGVRSVTNHNKLLWRCEGVEGIKTGFTKAAGRILVSSAMRHGRRLICVSINAPDDWNDHSALLNDCYSKFELVPLCHQGDVFGDGLCASCDAVAALLPGEAIDKIRVILQPEGGSVEFLIGERVAAACPLVPTEKGAHNERASTEDPIVPGGNLPQKRGGAHPCRAGAHQREYCLHR